MSPLVAQLLLLVTPIVLVALVALIALYARACQKLAALNRMLRTLDDIRARRADREARRSLILGDHSRCGEPWGHPPGCSCEDVDDETMA